MRQGEPEGGGPCCLTSTSTSPPTAGARRDVPTGQPSAASQQFLYREARLLDERRWDEWLALWTDDGMYWVPQQHDQASPYDHISLFWEDKMLREVRVRRVENARNWSQQPLTRSVHVIGNMSIEGLDAAGHLIVRSCFQLTEWRNDQRQLAGVVIHKLAATPEGGWKIMLKRVDLVNCDSVFGTLEVFI